MKKLSYKKCKLLHKIFFLKRFDMYELDEFKLYFIGDNKKDIREKSVFLLND